jgi:hypothetical protein
MKPMWKKGILKRDSINADLIGMWLMRTWDNWASK